MTHYRCEGCNIVFTSNRKNPRCPDCNRKVFTRHDKQNPNPKKKYQVKKFGDEKID